MSPLKGAEEMTTVKVPDYFRYALDDSNYPFNPEMLDALKDGTVYNDPFHSKDLTTIEVVESIENYLKHLHVAYEKNKRIVDAIRHLKFVLGD